MRLKNNDVESVVKHIPMFERYLDYRETWLIWESENPKRGEFVVAILPHLDFEVLEFYIMWHRYIGTKIEDGRAVHRGRQDFNKSFTIKAK